MRVVIAGAHGQIARLLSPLLWGGGHEVVGLVRNPEHLNDLGPGVEAVLCDLEHADVAEIAVALNGADAAIFAAGAGAGSGVERKATMDRDGAVKLLEAASRAGVERFLIVSSVGAENPPDDDEAFSVYLRAKAAADAAVRTSDRRWTIVRPGALTDAPAGDRVRIDTEPFRGEVPRADVAAVLAAVLEDSRAEGAVLYVNGGEQTVADALDGALGASG